MALRPSRLCIETLNWDTHHSAAGKTRNNLRIRTRIRRNWLHTEHPSRLLCLGPWPAGHHIHCVLKQGKLVSWLTRYQQLQRGVLLISKYWARRQMGSWTGSILHGPSSARWARTWRLPVCSQYQQSSRSSLHLAYILLACCVCSICLLHRLALSGEALLFGHSSSTLLSYYSSATLYPTNVFALC